MSSLIRAIPRSLREFTYVTECETLWPNSPFALSAIPPGVNRLAINLRDFSACLRELWLHSPTLPLDLMWPLNKDGQPILERGSLWWPHLDTWQADFLDPWNPSGDYSTE